MLIAGVDEAGRGPCFGPMVIAITVCDSSKEKTLKEMGIKDSKLLTEKKRDSLFEPIKEIVEEHQILSLEPREINSMMTRESLNEIEAIKIAELINKLDSKPEKVFVDSPDAIAKNFEKRIRKYLTNERQKIIIVSENKADSKYLIVGAASILAKVSRDNAIKELAKKYGDFGSGYPSDPYTKEYLAKYVKETGKLPPFSRIFWKTCENALEVRGTKQEKLF